MIGRVARGFRATTFGLLQVGAGLEIQDRHSASMWESPPAMNGNHRRTQRTGKESSTDCDATCSSPNAVFIYPSQISFGRTDLRQGSN